MDSYEGNNSDPVSLHKYLYSANNPANYSDPSGFFTQKFGYLAEAAIQAIYQIDHPNDAVLYGQWSRFPGFFKLKPDMLNFTTKRWAEVKPFSPSGVISAADSYRKYAPFSVIGYFADVGWYPSMHTTLAGSVPIVFWNAGGIIFYTDYLDEDFLEDTLALSTVKLAADYMAKNSARVATRTLFPALVRIGMLANTRVTADTARLGAHVGIAALLASLGGF